MKPDCQQVLTQFASFSVEELSDAEASTLLHHMEECEPCKGQWLLFEKSLTIVTQSGPRDEDVEQYRSQQMWLVCMDHARQKTAEKPALAAKVAAHKQPQGKSESQSDSQNSSVLVAPRIGMTLVGGALLMLASSYWIAPHSQPATDVALPPMPAQLQTVGFKNVPRSIAPMVDYGATLGFDAVSDPIAPSLISAPTKNLVVPVTPPTR